MFIRILSEPKCSMLIIFYLTVFSAKLKSIEEAEAAKRRELAMSREEQCSPLDILAHQTSVLGHRFRKPFPRKFV